jgi:hypothetical protein
MIAQLVEQLARRGKIKKVYMFDVSCGLTRYLGIYMRAMTYISHTANLRDYPLVRHIYAGLARHLQHTGAGYCSTAWSRK